MQDQDANLNLDPRVEAYLTGRLSEAEEKAFCDELLDSPHLQKQVLEAGLLRDALEDSGPVRRSFPWFHTAAALLFGLVIGGVVMDTEPEFAPLITGAPHTVAGEVRGTEEVLVLPSARDGVTLLFPAGRCRGIQWVEVFDPDDEIIVASRIGRDSPGFTLTLPTAQAGEYRAEITYSDCPAETRSFSIAPAEPASIPKTAEPLVGRWTIQPGATTDLVLPGGTLEIDIATGTDGAIVTLQASGMGERDRVWNEATALQVQDGEITGLVTHNEHVYNMRIVYEGGQIHGSVRSTGIRPKDDEDDGDWTGEPE